MNIAQQRRKHKFCTKKGRIGVGVVLCGSDVLENISVLISLWQLKVSFFSTWYIYVVRIELSVFFVCEKVCISSIGICVF